MTLATVLLRSIRGDFRLLPRGGKIACEMGQFFGPLSLTEGRGIKGVSTSPTLFVHKGLLGTFIHEIRQEK